MRQEQGKSGWSDRPRKEQAPSSKRPTKAMEPLTEKIAVVSIIDKEGNRTMKTLKPGKKEEIEIESGKLEIISTEKIKIKMNIED